MNEEASNCFHDQKARMDQLKQKEEPMKNIPIYTLEYVDAIREWHHDRNLIEGSTDKDQFCKLMQEAGELSDSICKGKDVSDDIGDMMVVLINIAERNKLSLRECLKVAWGDIKNRKGKMIDGIFVKETDL
jgi:uncharacterized protein YabN with tetrapyrrole methylase and pyrophosphatase domain